MKPFCPHCGFDLVKDRPIILNDFSMMAPGSQLFHRGAAMGLTPAESTLCWALMKCHPQPVRVDVLLDRLGSEGTSNVVAVAICRIRKKFKRAGLESVIVPARTMKHAYCWSL